MSEADLSPEEQAFIMRLNKGLHTQLQSLVGSVKSGNPQRTMVSIKEADALLSMIQDMRGQLETKSLAVDPKVLP